MSDNQLEMTLASGGRPVNEITEQMQHILKRMFLGVWATRKDLERYGLSDRQCRLGRQHSNGKIIAGQFGYKLTEDATINEICQAANTLHSQATAMLREETELWRVLHGRGVEKQQQKEGDTV